MGIHPVFFARDNSTSVKMSTFPSKHINLTQSQFLKNQVSFLELDKLVLKFMWKRK